MKKSFLFLSLLALFFAFSGCGVVETEPIGKVVDVHIIGLGLGKTTLQVKTEKSVFFIHCDFFRGCPSINFGDMVLKLTDRGGSFFLIGTKIYK